MTTCDFSTWRMRKMTDTFGVIIEPNDNLSKASDFIHATEPLRALLKERGAVLLRGFDLDVATMEEVSSPFGNFVAHRATTYGNRESITETTATVNNGTLAFPWHRELGYAPFPPDIVFFFCERPAQIAGETFISDGCAIIDRIDEATRAFVLENSVQYVYDIPRAAWPLLLKADNPETAHAALQQIQARLSVNESLAWELVASKEKFVVRYSAPMTITTRWSKRPAFCNQVIFQARYNLKLSNGNSISPDVIHTLQQAADACAFPIAWQPADMAIVDNSRIMHARGDVLDPNRRILARLCYANF